MLKKFLLTTCLALGLTAFGNPSWAQDEDEDGFVSAPAASKASKASKAKAAMDDDEDEDEEEADELNGGAELTVAQRKEMLERKKFEEEQRQDEYANSERRRDWLRNRLILQMGMGSRYAFSGETGMGMSFGMGAEYILPFHLSLFGSFGFLPKGTDNAFEQWTLEGGSGWKVGLNYYLFPKNPLHLGVSVSYGTVYYDHDVTPNDEGVRSIIKVDGIQGDILITYLTNEWYYLQFSIGMYYAPKLAKNPEQGVSESTDNPSWAVAKDGSGYWINNKENTWISRVENESGMKKTGIVFGLAIGYALPELFPDDTEKRRREREKARARSGAAGR